MESENHSIAYLKMHKNPTTKLKSEEDYLRWAEKCLDEANAYFEISIRCMDMIYTINNSALLTNVSFACELYLKYLLLTNKIDCRNEHNLLKLFKKLPKETQENLKKIHPCGNTSIDKFELELEDIGHAFTIFRYIYERGNMAFNLQFLMELLFTLHSSINNKKEK